MSKRIIALFNLKPGVTREAYEAWARDIDMPAVRSLASISGFEVFRGTGRLGSDAPSPYDYIEIIDVVDMEAFGIDASTSLMQQIAAAFQSMAEIVFILTEKVA